VLRIKVNFSFDFRMPEAKPFDCDLYVLLKAPQ